MSSIATRYFTRLGDYEVIICKECKHAVWPKEVGSHLGRRHHKMKKEGRKSVQQAIDISWRGLIADPARLVLPVEIKEPIPELPLYEG